MITTREINVNLDKGRRKLIHVTTKNVDASVKIEQPKKPIKTQSISTNSMADVADIAEKRRRDEIMAERKKEIEIITAPAIVEDGKGNLISTTDDEKMFAMKEKMAKVRAAKGKK